MLNKKKQQASKLNTGEKKPGKIKKIIIISAVLMAVILVGGGIVFLKLKGKMPNMGDNNFTNMTSGTTTDATMAYGVINIGTVDEALDIDNMTTNLVVEKIYFSSGDTVREGDVLVSFTAESVAEALAELESNLREKDLAYRAGAIEYEESLINAKYNYDSTILKGEQADAVYNESVASLKSTLQSAKDTYNEKVALLAEYKDAQANETYYTTYNVEYYKTVYEENLALLYKKMDEWNVPWQDVTSGGGGMSSGGSGMGSSGTGSTAGTAGDSSVGTGGFSGGDFSGGDFSGSMDMVFALDDSEAPEGSGEVTVPGGDGAPGGITSDGEMPEGQTPVGQTPGESIETGSEGTTTGTTVSAETYSQYKSILQSLYSVLNTNYSEYQSALNTYESAMADLNYNIMTLELDMASLEETYLNAQESYETSLLSAEQTRQTAKTNAELAQSEYEAKVEKAKTDYDSLKDAYEDAQADYNTFVTRIVNNQYLASESGTVSRGNVRTNGRVSAGSRILSYSDREEITVSVSVDQADIAKLAVGDSAICYSEDSGMMNGTIVSISPVTTSESISSVTYSVTVKVTDTNANISSNTTVTVIFGMDMASASGLDLSTSGSDGNAWGDGNMPDMSNFDFSNFDPSSMGGGNMPNFGGGNMPNFGN